ncbi:MAG: transposase family protein [Bacteroidota bacterium]
MNQSTAKRNHTLGLKVLNLALDQAGSLPIRSFDTVEEFHQYFEAGEVLIIDATEQLIQRPEDREVQRETYSGKKKANTQKVMIISTLDRFIHYVSVVYTGRTHDFSLLKEEFPPEEPWFEPYQIRVDLGYQGFSKDYPGVQVYLPNKKSRKTELTDEQKNENKELAKQRIPVEHSIGGMKRYDVLSGKSRFHDLDIINLVIENCAGLWNFYLNPS